MKTPEKLDEYDLRKLKEAKKKMNEIYEYNYSPSSPLSKKLETIIRKMDILIDATEEVER